MKQDALRKSLQERLQRIQGRNTRLVKQWSPFIDAVGIYMKEHQERSLSSFDKQNMAVCLENAATEVSLRGKSRILEATEESDITFLGIQLPVIAALLPSLVLNKLAIVQALDRRQGAVFYLDVEYGTDKGAKTSGASMIAAKTGVDRTVSGRRYAMAMVEDESPTDWTGDGSTVTFGPVTLGGAARFGSGIVLGTVEVTAGAIVGHDAASDGVIAGTGISGTVTDAGVLTVEFTSAPASGVSITVDYQYTYDAVEDSSGDKSGVPEVNINLTSSLINAIDFTLKCKYSLGASIDLEKAHGLNLESELVKYLGGEIGNGFASLAIAA